MIEIIQVLRRLEVDLNRDSLETQSGVLTIQPQRPAVVCCVCHDVGTKVPSVIVPFSVSVTTWVAGVVWLLSV